MSATLNARQELKIDRFLRIAERLLTLVDGGKIEKTKEWGNREDANKVLGRNYSAQWYKDKRLGRTINGKRIDPVFIEGKDWRRRGKFIEFNLVSLENFQP